MELQPPPIGSSPSARGYIGRVESILREEGFDRTEMQALLDDARAVQILDETDLQDILRWLEHLGRRLLTVGETDLGVFALTAAADVTLSAMERGLPTRCALILADNLQSLGLDDVSTQLLAATRAAVENAGGGNFPLQLAQLDNMIGGQFRMAGDLDLAHERLQLALEEFDKSTGGPPALRSSILNNLGLVLLKKGVLKEAGDHLRSALQIQVDIGTEPKGIAVTLDNLAFLEIECAQKAGLKLGQGYINQVADEHLLNAEAYLDQARTAFEDALPDAATDYAICLTNLADIARYRDDAKSADRFSQDALEILEQTGGLDALWAARSLRAAVLYEQGRCAAVVDLLSPFTEAPVNSTAATAFTYLARAAARIGDTSMSLQGASMAASIDDRLVLDRIQSISEAEALHQFQPFTDRLEFVLGVGLEAGADADWLYGLTLNRIGVLAERFGSHWIKEYTAKGAPTELVERVRSSRATAAQVDLDGADASSIRSARRLQDEAARHAGLAEAELLRAVRAEAPLPAPISPSDVRATLNADCLLLDFAFVQMSEDVRHYALFVVRSTSTECRDLGPVEEIDKLIIALETAARRRSADRDMSWSDAAKNEGIDAPEESCLEAADKLAEVLFSLELDLPTTVRVSPIGLWYKVPFSLLTPQGRPLIEDHVVSYVPSGRWLGVRALSSSPSGGTVSPPIIIGDPDYDFEDYSEQVFPLWMRFGRLSNAAIEVRELAARLQVEPRTGKDANRTLLANLRSPVILHLATHGTMVDAFSSIAEMSEPRATTFTAVGGIAVGRDVDLSESPLGVVIPGFSDGSAEGRHHARVRWLTEIGPRDPLSRSLIVLAGANAWLAGRENSPEIGTGFLSAAEFALTDLTSTELVVLSACETGEGAVSVGDGTLVGLRSAALLAGAATCLTAIWTVDDAATTELMLAFYGALERGAARDEALREAQLVLRASRPDPYYWGAWVLDGENGPFGTQSWMPAQSGTERAASLGYV